jgi:two-component system LytT family response regulator
MSIVPLSKSSAPMRIRTMIVDDEPAARRGLRLLLERDPMIDVIGEAVGGRDALRMMAELRPELAFLDVQMPELDGFELLAALGEKERPVVVFVTAHDDYALKAFEVSAVDYLLKPFDDARFMSALNRAKEAVRNRHHVHVDARLNQLLSYLETATSAPPADGRDRILVKSSGEIFFLKAEEIDWIEAEGDYMKFHVAGKCHLMRETMARLEARLDAKRFVRIHRSTIVNIDRMRKLSPSFAGEYAVVLQDGTKLRLSRGYQDRIAGLLKESL